MYGLCGLRVGYSLGSEEFRLAVDRVRQPFSVNALALAAATEALNHVDEVERRVEQTAIERMHVDTELEERGLETSDSQANFLGVARRPRRGRGRGRPGEAGRSCAAARRSARSGWMSPTALATRTTASSQRWTP